MSEPITMTVPHQLTKLDAKARLESGFGRVQEQIGQGVTVEQHWDGDVMSFSAGVMGQNVTGTVIVRDSDVVITLDLPWILARIAGTVQDKLRKGTQVLLEKK